MVKSDSVDDIGDVIVIEAIAVFMPTTKGPKDPVVEVLAQFGLVVVLGNTRHSELKVFLDTLDAVMKPLRIPVKGERTVDPVQAVHDLYDSLKPSSTFPLQVSLAKADKKECGRVRCTRPAVLSSEPSDESIQPFQ